MGNFFQILIDKSISLFSYKLALHDMPHAFCFCEQCKLECDNTDKFKLELKLELQEKIAAQSINMRMLLWNQQKVR
jgi:hypothetical protein